MLNIRGRPGLYLRLFDVSRLCPHISFTQPWANPLGVYDEVEVEERERNRSYIILQVLRGSSFPPFRTFPK